MQDQATVHIGLWLNERKAKQTFGVNCHIGLWLNERKAKQTFGVNCILGMDDDVGELDILVFTSMNKGCSCIVLCFRVFHHLPECVSFKVKMLLFI